MYNFLYTQWINRFSETINACEKINGFIYPFSIHPKATFEEITETEETLGYNLPKELKIVLLEFSKCVYFGWNLPKKIVLYKNNNFQDKYMVNVPNFNFKEIHSGGILDYGLWNLDKLISYDETRQDYEFFDEDSLYSYWSNSVIFTSCGNGDYLGIDMKYNIGEVIYLSTNYHMHGWRLGKSFISFFNEWINIGCAGHWGEELYLFSSNDSPYVSSISQNSLIFKKILNINP